MANLEELKKLAEEKGIELTDDMLEDIAGGRYSLEEWDAMSDDERIAAQMRSIMARAQGQPCELD
ncbi:MAG: hypothetical protein IJ872_02850 [Eubacterium sp.]|nr:hypothetical protein [Eubacterium sp.]MBR2278130.1 hypothetical protein [Eubacterium sp.]